MPTSKADLLHTDRRCEHMHHNAHILFQGQSFQQDIVTCTLVLSDLILRKFRIYCRDINYIVLFSSRLKHMGIGCLTNLALELSEVVTAQVRHLFHCSLGSNPLLQTSVMDVLDTTSALTCREEGV